MRTPLRPPPDSREYNHNAKQFLNATGTDYICRLMGVIVAGDVPTLNQNTTDQCLTSLVLLL